MTSKTPCFNKTLFRKNVLGLWPLWGVISLLGVIISLGILNLSGYITQVDYETVFETLPIINPALAITYAMVCALLVWKYIFLEKQTVFYHSLPMRREGLFLTNYLSGLAIMLIPYVCIGTTVVASSLIHGAFNPYAMLRCILLVLGENIFFFSLATFVAFTVGHIASYIILYYTVNFVAVFFELVITGLASGFWMGIDITYNSYVRFLSPCVNMIAELEEENTWVVAVYAAVGILLAAGALLMYRRRKSESAGEVVAAGVLRPVFKYAFAVMVAVIGGSILYNLLYLFAFSNTYRFVPMLLCVLLMGSIGYYAALMMLEKTVRVFKKKNLTGLILVSVAMILLCGSFKLDFFGVEGRTARAEDISRIELVTEGGRCEAGSDDAARMQKILDLHAVILENRKDLRYVDGNRDWYDISDSSVNVEFIYTLKNGDTFERSYRFWSDVKPVYDTYKNLLDDPDVIRGFLSSDGVKISDIRLGREGADDFYERASVHPVDYPRLLEALEKDADKIDLFKEEAGEIIISIYTEEREKDYYNNFYLSFTVTEDMKNTIEELVSEGLVVIENGTLKVVDNEYELPQK